MRFCFIIEEQYRYDPMPMIVADQLLEWGHTVTLLEPGEMVTCLTNMREQDHDAYVLKSIARGPGLSILEAAEAIGIPTINSSRAIRMVRDKAVAVAYACSNGLPIPPTYFVSRPHLLKQIPPKDYPLVVKPGHGNSSQGIYLIESSEKLADLQMAEIDDGFFLAQRYMENPGFDLKIYVIGKEVCATIAKKSPLHATIDEESIAPTREIRKLALDIGNIFGLEIYGIDVVETPQGLVLLDINDFPSFGGVPSAAIRVSEHILDAVKKAKKRRAVLIEHNNHTHHHDPALKRISILD